MANMSSIILLGIVLVVGVSHASMSSQVVTSSQTTSTTPNTTLETSPKKSSLTISFSTAKIKSETSSSSSSSQPTSTTPNITSETSHTISTATTTSATSSSKSILQITTTRCETTSTTESIFGRHGAFAVSLSLIIAIILLFVLIIVLFHDGYCKKKPKFLSHKQLESSRDRHDDACTVDFSSAEENTSSQKSQAVETIQTESTKVSQENKCEEDESATKSLTESRPDIQMSTVTDVNTGTDERPSNLQESITVPNADHSEIKEQTEVTKADDKEMKDSDDKADVVSNHTDELTQKTKESGAGNQEFVVVDLNSPDECSSSESREKRGDETDQPGNSNPSEEPKTETKEKKRLVATFLKSIKKYVRVKTEKSSVEENEEGKGGLELGQSENGAGLASANDVTSTVPPVTDEIKESELITDNKKNADEVLTDNITKADQSENKDVEDCKINSSDNGRSSEGKADDIKHTDTSEENKNDTNKSNSSATSSMAENQPTESAKESSSATSANADETKSDFQQKPDKMTKD